MSVLDWKTLFALELVALDDNDLEDLVYAIQDGTYWIEVDFIPIFESSDEKDAPSCEQR